MNSKDLRLGNLVLFRGKICKVTTLSGDIIRVDEPEVGIVEQAYPKTPIELTPEILEACGFHKNEDGEFYKDDVFIEQDGSKWDYQLMNDEGENSYNLGIRSQYLHQLQNLYYSLTGEELTISLPTVKLEEK